MHGVLFRIAQDSHIVFLGQAQGNARRHPADRIGMDLGNDHTDLAAVACTHGPGHEVGPVARLLNGPADPFLFFLAEGASVDIPAYCSRRNSRQLRYFFDGHDICTLLLKKLFIM